jgi:two-component system, NarL family, response regulator DevR
MRHRAGGRPGRRRPLAAGPARHHRPAGTPVHQAPHAHHPDSSMSTTTAREEHAPAASPLERPDRLPEDGVVSTPPLRVMLVDDHEVVRDGIKALLAATDDIVVCAEAATVRQAVAEADRALPDVIVMDVRLQDGSGIEATRDIRAARPATQVLMLTSFADDQALFASIMAGASGYVLKQIRGDALVQAIRTVGAGQSLLDPVVTKGVLDRLRKGKHLLKDERLARLSPQEERILELVAAGRTNKQIGQELRLAEKTVKNYVSSILAKLEVTRRAEAASYLTRHTTTPGT